MISIKFGSFVNKVNMQFYYPENNINSAWNIPILAEITEENKKKLNLEEKITSEQFWEQDQPISLQVLAFKEEQFLDYYNLSLDLNWDVCVCLLSSRLRKIVEKFSIPRHTWYQVELTLANTEKKASYHLLHLQGNVFTELDYIHTTISRLNQEGKPVYYYEEGEIKSYTQFVELRAKNTNYHVMPTHFLYRKIYDFFWGGYKFGIFSKSLKEAIEKAGIDTSQGMNMVQFDGYSIEFSKNYLIMDYTHPDNPMETEIKTISMKNAPLYTPYNTDNIYEIVLITRQEALRKGQDILVDISLKLPAKDNTYYYIIKKIPMIATLVPGKIHHYYEFMFKMSFVAELDLENIFFQGTSRFQIPKEQVTIRDPTPKPLQGHN